MPLPGIVITTLIFGTAAVSLAVAIYSISLSEKRKWSFTMLMLSLTVWSLGYGLEIISTTATLKILFLKLKYAGVIAAPIFWLLSASSYTNKERWLTPLNHVLLLIMPVVTTYFVWTNEKWGLIWHDIRFETVGTLILKNATHGWWFWIHTTYSYVLILSGSLMILRKLTISRGFFRQQTIIILVSIGAPWISNSMYLSGFNPLPHIDLTPFGFTISGLTLIWGHLRFQLLDILPVARQNVIDGMSDAVIVLDDQNRIVELNPSARKTIGSARSVVIGQAIDRAGADWVSVIKPLRLQDEYTGEVTFRQDGSERTYDLRVTPVRDDRDNFLSRVIVMRDISRRKQTEQKLQRSEAALTRSFEELKQTQAQLIQSAKLASIGELAAGVAHELNQPLTVIRTFTQVLQRRFKKEQIPAQEVERHLEMLEKNTARMMKIINHLRTFSRRSDTEAKAIDVNYILEECFQMVEQQFRAQDIAVKRNLLIGIPKIIADPDELEQVFLNLMTNAKDSILARKQAANSGPHFLEVTTRLAGRDRDECIVADPGPTLTSPPVQRSEIQIFFRDSGTGIADQHLEKIFDPFFTTKEVGKGTGLGLSVSYGIIQNHKGEICVTRTGPQGTTFRITLPIQD